MNEPGDAVPSTMEAWCARAYGEPEVLELRRLPLAPPAPGEVLVRMEATTVSSGDRRVRALDVPRGLGPVLRLVFGLRRPRNPVLGTEFTGIVAAVGAGVTRFRPGDAVIGFPGARMGAHAAFVRMPAEGRIVPRPPGLAVEAAAALAFGGTTARHFLRRAALRPRERVLVIGAAGTVGSALVQLAAEAGAEVTALASGKALQRLPGLGAARVLDRAREGLAAAGGGWDVVADAPGALDFARALPLLAEGGRYLAINAGLGGMLARAKGSRCIIAGPAEERREDLEALAALAAIGRFRPLIDRVLPFAALPEAHARADSGRKQGSVVVLGPP
jgi:NADPH:quinone reductase-like Zn-dependent oxidoreductase